MRPSNIVYDRTGSSFSLITPDQFDWDVIFDSCDLFHYSGITPSLSNSTKELTVYALKEAKKRKVKVSCDLNYRSNLWSPEEAQKTMIPLMEYTDILIGGKKDPEIMLGEFVKNEEDDSYKELLVDLAKKYNLSQVGLSLRESFSADHNDWAGLFYNDEKVYASKKYQIQIVDRVGAGDAFTAGLIYGLYSNMSNQEIVEFGVAASALAHTFQGDFNLATVQEVQDVASGDVTGRIRR